MFDYLRRLATTGAAYTAASVVSKLLAVALLPLYTSYLTTADYGAAEVLFTTVVTASIIVRLGLIEALLRFFYLPEEDGDEVVRTGFAALFWATTAGALIALPFAEPISEALLDTRRRRPRADLDRRALGADPLRVPGLALPPRRAGARPTSRSRSCTSSPRPAEVLLVVGLDEGARGLLLGSYLSGVPFIAWFAWSERRRLSLWPERDLLRRMVRFGLPTMPAELSLYSLQFIDRIIIVRSIGLAEAGLYALAFKFSQAIQVVVRGFQLAWPPLAYSIHDDDEARRTYAVVAHRLQRALRAARRRPLARGALDRPPARRRALLRRLRGRRPARPRRRALRRLPRPSS